MENQAGNHIFCHMHIEIAGKIVFDELAEIFPLQGAFALIALDLHEEHVFAAAREPREGFLLIRAIAQEFS